MQLSFMDTFVTHGHFVFVLLGKVLAFFTMVSLILLQAKHYLLWKTPRLTLTWEKKEDVAVQFHLVILYGSDRARLTAWLAWRRIVVALCMCSVGASTAREF